jgi:very-short-patch-repair endonuclease
MRERLDNFSSLPSGPYDSPMEEWFLHHLVKYLAPEARYDDHVPIDTLCGPFVVDYVIRAGGRVVGFEIDGRDYHGDRDRDKSRDVAILEARGVDTIYRLRGADLFRYPNECLLAVARCDPELFSDRGRINLERLAHADARSLAVGRDDRYVDICVWDDSWIQGDLDSDDLDDGAYADLPPRERERRLRAERLADRGQGPYVIFLERRRGEHFAGEIGLLRRIGRCSLELLTRETSGKSLG